MFKFKCFFNLTEAFKMCIGTSHVVPTPASKLACYRFLFVFIKMERCLSTKTFTQSMAGFAS